MVVNWFGPTDFEELYDGLFENATNYPPGSRIHKNAINSLAAITAFLGGDLDSTTRTDYRRASPVHYVDEGDPPVLTLHGTEDWTVLFTQALFLDEMFELLDIGHKHDFDENEFQGDGHGFGGVNVRRRANERSWAFIEEHFQP